MSHLELENLLHYERNLAACYEAEYLLELTMQREYISGGLATNWAGYDDSSETQLVAPHMALPHASSAFNSLAHTHAAEMVYAPAKASSDHRVSSSLQSSLSLPTTVPTEALHNSHRLLNHISQHQSPPAFTATTNPHHLLLNPPFTTGPPFNHHSPQDSHRAGQPPPSHPLCEGVCGDGVSDTHSDGPLRKKMCLQRPEL